MAGSKHKPNLSQSSNSSSEDGTTSRASSSSHAQPSTSQQPTLSRWERLRRPSAASSTKRPTFADASSSTVTSPTSPFFPLPSPGAQSSNMMRTASDDSYMHILAASAAARKAAMDSGAVVSDTASVSSFTCSLSKEFDRQRTDVATLNASLPDLPASAQASIRVHSTNGGGDKKQAWLDTTFNKLSARYRCPKKAKAPALKPNKPHFLDLSSIICPIPARPHRATPEDEGEAGDRSSSSSSSFASGPDSSFEAMSGWDVSSADTSYELRTPQAEDDRACYYDFTTPRPSQMQRFASAQAAALGSGMRLPSPPLISPLMPNFALPTSGASTPGFAPPSANNYGFPPPPQMSGRGVTVDDIQHKPTLSVRTTTNGGTLPAMRQLRKQKSFDNPAELRRRQKQEWSVGGPKPPGFGGNAGLTIGIPTQPVRGGGLLSPQTTVHPLQRRSPGPSQAMLLPPHSRVADMARPSAMQRGMSHDTSLSPPRRPGLAPRASSSALRTLDTSRLGLAPAMSDIDPHSSTGFSHSARPTPSGRRMVSSPLTSPTGVPPPLLPASSRESFGSSATESLPPTPLSGTFLRLPGEPPISPRETRRERDGYGTVPLGSALGLMPGKMVRAYSDFSHPLPADEVGRVRVGSRLRDDEVGRTHMTPRQKPRPEMRREHTSNAILTSPQKTRSPPSAAAMEASFSASATITPRSSSLKDLLAAEAMGGDVASLGRTSTDSGRSDSSLAYTKPSPLIQQGEASSLHSITPTNSYSNIVHTPTKSQWSPESPAPKTQPGAFVGARQRANSRADEFAANFRKFTGRSTAPMPTATGAK